MKKGAFHSSGRLDVEMLINRFRLQRFVFTADSVAFDITNFTWELNIRQNVGSWTKLVTLSTANGKLAFPIYETNVLEARFEAADVNVPVIKEGPMYWELVRTDTNEIWLSGTMLFKYGLLESVGDDDDVTVNIANNTISVELQAIVQVSNGSSTGGGASLINWPIASGVPDGSVKGTRYYLTGSAGVILGEAVAEGTTMESRIAGAGNNRADWYFNMGGS